MKRLAYIVAILPFLFLAGRSHAQIDYGRQIYPAQGAFIVERPADGKNMIVGAQINAWAYGGGDQPIFAGATESINFGAATGNQIGWENGVVNFNPTSPGWKVGNNSVFKCAMDGAPMPCRTPNNITSMAYLVTAQPGTGWESGIRFGYYSLADSPWRHATVIDLGDLPMFKDYVLFRLPGGREVTISEFERALDRP